MRREFESESVEHMLQLILENVRSDVLEMRPLAFIVVRWTSEGIQTELHEPLIKFGPTFGEMLAAERSEKNGKG